MSPTEIIGYLLLFAGTASAVVFGGLLLGRFLRPSKPSPSKLEVYECGEQAVGSGFLQFDLRFYVVALVFIIFDVEVAFFFPWAIVYGKAVRELSPPAVAQSAVPSAPPADAAAGQVTSTLEALGVPADSAKQSVERTSADGVSRAALTLSRAAMLDMAVFFAVLLVGFAYVWRRGDLDWVRAIGLRSMATAPPASEPSKGRV